MPRPTYPAYAITAVCSRADPARIAMVEACPVVTSAGSAPELLAGQTLRLQRSEVVAWMKLGVAFFVYRQHGSEAVKARVILEEIDGDTFLRTSPNVARADRLGELPAFDCGATDEE